MKMELIEGSETSAISTQTPGNYPKENILHLGILPYSHKGHLFFCEPYGKQQLLPYTALTMWSLYLRHGLFAVQ